ncbi:MAG: DUF4834 family protein [Rikenellaceae bacterium]
MGAFLSVIFFIITGFYLLGAILRLVLRLWLTRKAKEFEKSGGFGGFTSSGGGFQGFGGQQESRKSNEGEIKVQKTEQEQKRVSEKVGEYVDFDEVK